MKKTDKLLLGIVLGIVLLVVVAFILALTKPTATYLSDATPEGVAFNYLFALQQKDYQRAYGYIYPLLPGYPRTLDIFVDNIQGRSWTFSRMNDSTLAMEVESASTTGNQAYVKIKETWFRESGLFESSQSTHVFTITLCLFNGDWKVLKGESYWLTCWNTQAGCK